MKKAIVTTTIHEPNSVIRAFIAIAEQQNWDFIIVGDRKTNHEAYYQLEEQHGFVHYLNPDAQESMSQELSDLIGWNCIQRRNFGILFAYQIGAEIIATVDDDNYPKLNWGADCAVGKQVEALHFTTTQEVFDPLAPYKKKFWHRGFPIELVKGKNEATKYVEARKVKCLVQADLWDGEPDVDALCRVSMDTQTEFNDIGGFVAGDKISPFNSQNTFLHRSVIAEYFLFPHVGRMDDIWAAYAVQHKFPGCVIYGKASVHQERNAHSNAVDMEAEMIGYHHSLKVSQSPEDLKAYLPGVSLAAWKVWRKLIEESDAASK